MRFYPESCEPKGTNQPATKFRKTLEEMWEIRERELVSALHRRGRPPNPMNRDVRDELLERALDYAFDALRPVARREFNRLVCDKINSRPIPRVGTRGPLDWDTVEEFIGSLPNMKSDYHVYVFWNDDDCVYVGQSGKGHWGGGNKWDDSGNWRYSTYLQVFATWQERNLNKFECLAIDRFRPWNNRNRPPDEPYHAKCPVHETLWYLEDEIRGSYLLRR
jgi:hypothetical protein